MQRHSRSIILCGSGFVAGVSMASSKLHIETLSSAISNLLARISPSQACFAAIQSQTKRTYYTGVPDSAHHSPRPHEWNYAPGTSLSQSSNGFPLLEVNHDLLAHRNIG